MIEIKVATEADTEIIADLGALTYRESHARFIKDKNDLKIYIESAFSLSKTMKEMNDPNNLFYIVYSDKLPVAYAKLALNANHESINSKNTCQLERIYVLEKHINLKIGQKLLTYLEDKVKDFNQNSLWLSVYYLNKRAIKFYLKNNFIEIGDSYFMVNGKGYYNLVFYKKI